MTVKQVYNLVNEAVREATGAEALVTEDLGGVVDAGAAVFGASAVDAYVKALVNRIGRVIFVDRAYAGRAPAVLKDGWEFGSVMQKIQAELPVAVESEEWELTDGASYDPNIFHAPTVSAKFYNNKITFTIEMSFAEKQVKQSFAGADELNAFVSMLYTAVENALTMRIDALIMRTINDAIAETMYTEYNSGSAFGGATHNRAVNLLYMYNQTVTTSITAAKAITNPDFIRFAAFTMGCYADRMKGMSTLFNGGGKDRFTPADRLHVVLLSEFARAADAFLYGDTYHNEMVKLPAGESVSYWQGSGTGYAFSDTSAVKCKTHNGNTVTASGILGVMFDDYALGVYNEAREVTSNFNPKGLFYNNFYHFDESIFIDDNENFVVFFVADAS